MSSVVEVLLILLPSVWYIAGLRALWQRAGVGHVVSPPRAAAFLAGVVVLAVALFSPVDRYAEELFSAHMLQHLLLTAVAAPLCVIGAPLLPLLTALPASRRRTFAGWWLRAGWVRRAAHWLTQPLPAFMLHFVALWFWHFPVPYQAAARSEALHALEHVSFFGTAFLLWWVCIQPLGRRRTSEGWAILVVTGTLLQSGALGAVLMFASTAWYPFYAAGAAAHGMTPLEDQQLAGLLMWIPSGGVYIGAAAWLFLRMMGADARRIELAERAS